MLFNDFYLFLQFEGGAADLDEGDPSHYVYVTVGTVAGSDEQDQKIVVGRLRLIYLGACAALTLPMCSFGYSLHALPRTDRQDPLKHPTKKQLAISPIN